MKEFFAGLAATQQTKDVLAALTPIFGIIITVAVAAVLLILIKKIPAHMTMKANKREQSGKARALPAKRVETAAKLVSSVLKILVYIIAAANILTCLGFGSAVRSVLTFAGVGGVIVGLASQNVLSDVVNGLFMLMEDRFAVGDYVLVNGVEGTVESIGLRVISVRGYGGEVSTIPNSSITMLTNYSRTDSVAVVDVPVAMNAPVERAMALMEEEGTKLYEEMGAAAVEKPQIVGVNAFSTGAKVLRLTMKVKPLEHWQTKRSLNARITQRFIKEGIPLPFEVGKEKQ